MNKFFVGFFLLYSFMGYSQNKFDVYFDFNADDPNEIEMLKLNEWMESNNNVEIIAISGYCDSMDSNTYNKKLANRRINSVIEILKKYPIYFALNFKTNTVGEDFEQATKQSENRRVTFSYISKTQITVESSAVTVSQPTVAPIILSQEDKIEIERASLFDQFEKAKVGKRIAIYNINFELNTEDIVPISEPLLEELLFVMERNPNMVIKIYGHMCCNPNIYDIKLSSRRALKILNYLKDNGIHRLRLDYTGVGSNNPIYRIPERNEEEKLANRRVEIQIIKK